MSPIRSIGFIGIGKMGGPIAHHLSEAKFDLYIEDVRSNVLQSFLETNRCKRLNLDGHANLDAIVTMLPDGQAVHSVVLGTKHVRGYASRVRPGGLVIDMSSSAPIGTQELGAALAERDIGMVDAPVAGGVVFAENKSLSVLAGGDAKNFERCQPLFNAIASSVFYCGPLGSGHALKALCNYVNAVSLVSLLEAITTADRFGIEPDTAVSVLRAATTERNHPLEKKIVPHVMTRRFNTGMALGLIAKDVAIAKDLAKALSIDVPIMESCSSVWNQAVAQIGFNADQTEIARALNLEGIRSASTS